MKEQSSGCGRKMMNHEHYLLNLVDLKVRFQLTQPYSGSSIRDVADNFSQVVAVIIHLKKPDSCSNKITLEAPNMKLPNVVGTSESFPITISKRNHQKWSHDSDIIVSHCRCLLCQQKEVWLRLKCNLQGHVRGRNFASPDTRSNGKTVSKAWESWRRLPIDEFIMEFCWRC